MPTGEQIHSVHPFAIELAVCSDDLQTHWRRCNMLANYLAEYAAYQFTEREWAENLISTVANEFLEAMVWLTPAGAEVRIGCRQAAGRLEIELVHPLRAELAGPYLDFLAQLNGADVDDLYFALLGDVARPAPSFNQLGLVMIVHDFAAHVAASRAGPDGPVRVHISLPTGEIAER